MFLGLSSLASTLSRLSVSSFCGEERRQQMSEGAGVSGRRGGGEFCKEGRDPIMVDLGIQFLNSGRG